MTEKNDQPSGTANVLHQMKAYRELSEEYGAEGANLLGSKSLERNGVTVPPEGMDLESEGAVAASKVNALVGALLESNVSGSSRAGEIPEELDEGEDLDDEEEVEDEDELEDEDEDEVPDFGFEEDDDNDEAALDLIHKTSENAGD